MKHLFIGLLALLLALSLAACGAKESLEKKAGEALTEEIIENAGGGDVDIDGDKVTIQGEDGKELTIGEGEWPSSDLADSIPVFEDGKIVSVLEADNSLFIMMEDVSDEAFTAYLEEIKETFTAEALEMNTGTGMIYVAKNDEGIGITLTYEKDAGFSITVAQATPEDD